MCFHLEVFCTGPWLQAFKDDWNTVVSYVCLLLTDVSILDLSLGIKQKIRKWTLLLVNKNIFVKNLLLERLIWLWVMWRILYAWPSTCFEKNMLPSLMIFQELQYKMMTSWEIILTGFYFWWHKCGFIILGANFLIIFVSQVMTRKL